MDINDIDFKANKEKINNIKQTRTTVKKKKRLKKGIIQKLFCFLSIVFILICCVYYGKRLIKYYKIYNPSGSGDSTVYLASSILTNTPFVTEGDGAYRISGNVVYKGENVDNYIMYSNYLWRIVKIRSDNSLELVLEDYINIMPWNSTYTKYTKSDILKYLNDTFKASLNVSLLVQTSICDDDITSTTSITCNSINMDNYVSLLDVSSYLNSLQDNATYISSSTNKIWLANTNSNLKKVWNTSGSSITSSDVSSNYLVKPVITLASTSVLDSGKGTAEEPFVVKEENTSIKAGSYVKLDDDLWRVYEINKTSIKMEATKLITKSHVFSSSSNKYDDSIKSSLAEYLNTTYYNGLFYKDVLVKADYNIGEYETSYKDTENETINAYVGLLNTSDLKFDSKLMNYYLITPIGEKLYMYNSVLAESKVSVSRPIRPTIAIDANTKLKGNGTLEDPFTLEA